ncbi:MAG: ribosome silencing factor [Magnetococcales bacterium]|nr:ribosome silencing factor [Magnetococcales bacterium]
MTKSEENLLALSLKTCLEEKKGVDVTLLDLRERATFTDFFVVATGTSSTHVAALADEADRFFHERSIRVLSTTGLPEATWVLVDAGDIVVHLFQQETRAFYDLEKLWRHPPVRPNQPAQSDPPVQPDRPEPTVKPTQERPAAANKPTRDRPAPADQPIQSEQPAPADKPAREQPARTDKAVQPDRPAQMDKPDKAKKAAKADKPDKANKPDKAAKPDKETKPDKRTKPKAAKTAKVDRPDRPAKTKRP